MKFFSLINAFSWLETDLEILLMCSLTFSLPSDCRQGTVICKIITRCQSQKKRKGHLLVGLKELAPKWIPVEHPKLYSRADCVFSLYGRTAYDLSVMNKYKTKLHR